MFMWTFTGRPQDSVTWTQHKPARCPKTRRYNLRDQNWPKCSGSFHHVIKRKILLQRFINSLYSSCAKSRLKDALELVSLTLKAFTRDVWKNQHKWIRIDSPHPTQCSGIIMNSASSGGLSTGILVWAPGSSVPLSSLVTIVVLWDDTAPHGVFQFIGFIICVFHSVDTNNELFCYCSYIVNSIGQWLYFWSEK